MTIFTPRFKFPVPDFAIKPWHANLLTCLTRIDEVIFQSVITAGVVAWTTSTPFAAGQSVVDTLNGQFFTCLFTHTSGSGTFANDRLNHPTYWGLSTVAPENKGPWVAGTAYKNTDYVTHNNGYYVCLISHTGTVFSEDLAAGRWSVLIDLAPTLNNIAGSIESINEFNKVYLGAFDSDPIADNLGQPLIDGALYFNSLSDVLKVYTTGPGWTAITASAPNTAEYIVKSADAGLAQARVLTDWPDGGYVTWGYEDAGKVYGVVSVPEADKVMYSVGLNAWGFTGLSAFMRTMLDDTTAAAVHTTLGLGNVSTLSINGSTSQYLRGDGVWASLNLGNVSTININGAWNYFLCGDGAWRIYGNITQTNWNGHPSYFLRGDGVWAVPPDTNSGGTVYQCAWGLMMNGPTQILNDTNNFGGMGSTMLLAVGWVGANSVFAGGPYGGSWRSMSDTLAYAYIADGMNTVTFTGTLAMRVG